MTELLEGDARLVVCSARLCGQAEHPHTQQILGFYAMQNSWVPAKVRRSDPFPARPLSRPPRIGIAQERDFKCGYVGCRAAPFETQNLLEWDS